MPSEPVAHEPLKVVIAKTAKTTGCVCPIAGLAWLGTAGSAGRPLTAGHQPDSLSTASS